MAHAEQFLQDALAAFDFGGEVVGAVRYGSGHINDTFCVHTQPGEDPCRRFILQRISRNAFHHPEQVMANIAGITTYLKKEIAAQGGDPERETLNVIPSRDQKPYYRDSAGEYWRAYRFITDATSFDRVERPEDFYESALAFGNFQRLLSDYPAATLHETIPGFHDTEARFRAFREAVKNDICGRAAGCIWRSAATRGWRSAGF